MPAKPLKSPKAVRYIDANDPDLPKSFKVIDAKTPAEAVKKMYAAMTDQEITAVVWNQADKTLSAEAKEFMKDFSEKNSDEKLNFSYFFKEHPGGLKKGWYNYFGAGPGAYEFKRVFMDCAKYKKLDTSFIQKNPKGFKDWIKNTQDISKALRGLFDEQMYPSVLQHNFNIVSWRVWAGKGEGFHVDFNEVRLLREATGNPTFFTAPEDAKKRPEKKRKFQHQPIAASLPKMKDTILWRPKPHALLMFKTCLWAENHKPTPHSGPFETDKTSKADTPRFLEQWDVVIDPKKAAMPVPKR